MIGYVLNLTAVGSINHSVETEFNTHVALVRLESAQIHLVITKYLFRTMKYLAQPMVQFHLPTEVALEQFVVNA